MFNTIGVIGFGTVGTALKAAFEGKIRILICDPPKSQHETIENLVKSCSVIFVSVPTEQLLDGHADTTIFEHVIAEIGRSLTDALCPIICVKSAVPPLTIRRIETLYPNMKIVVSPEFLREKSSIDDMLAMRSLVLGSRERKNCELIYELFSCHSNIKGKMRLYILPDAVSAAFLKYQENSFLAMKVSFMNEFYHIFQALESQASWEQLQAAFHRDHERMGMTHWEVPGSDSMFGWGGRCFPKDIAALRAFASELNCTTTLMNAVVTRNEQDRIVKSNE